MARLRMVPVLAMTLVLVFALTAHAGVIINEIDYDQPGTDTAEWIELYNPDPVPQSLVDLELVMVNGSTCATYATYDLDPVTIPANGYVVIGNHPCADPSVTVPGSNWIQNGAPDGVQIVNRVSGALMDEIEYEGNNCLVTYTDIADDSSQDNYSIQYCPGQGWVGGVFSPCAANIECQPVGADDSSWGTLKSKF